MKLGLFAGRAVVAMPYTEMKVVVEREITLNTINNCEENGGYFVFSLQKNAENVEIENINDISKVGVLCHYEKKEPNEGGGFAIYFKAKSKVIISSMVFDKEKNAWEVECEPVIENKFMNSKNLKEKIQLLFEMFERKFPKNVSDLKTNISNQMIENPEVRSDFISLFNVASLISIHPYERQKWLEITNSDELIKVLNKAVAIKDDEKAIDREINNKINEALTKQQREFYLREKLKVVKEELGELSSKEEDVDRLRIQLESNPYPEHIKIKIRSEINRLEACSMNEVNMMRSYIEAVLELPWWQKTTDNKDISKVIESLNETHYGLEKVKERIVEYLAVNTRSEKAKGPILCLVGPPGVGKSSLAHSVATAIDKVFVKMALGGVKDESEIRGHRRTYLGSMPGRIIKAMKKAGVINPLFLLDEIDKMSSDFRGDPSSALLEVLDPEQNSKFSDNYIEEDYDLSNVLFFATANYADQIPHALYDRLEIIELSSYTEREKLEIAKRHLIPKVLEESNVSANEFSINDDAILHIIRHYTVEAGVRELERLLRKIVRKHLVNILTKKIESHLNVTKDIVSVYLDKIIYDYTQTDKTNIPGVVNGMAYTQAGGDLLQIEVTSYPGTGKVVITGNLKETMKESSEVALSFVKTNAKEFGLENIDFKEIDISIHVPSGGVPKDGPSAGVTLATAIISSLSKKSVPNNISMTGEITLRGKVLIIGGVKEKIISAYRGGVRNIFIPEKDERFLSEVPKEILDDIKINLVNDYKKDIFDKIFQ